MKESIPMHVKSLDEQLEGGIPKGHVTLICGPTGSMKSTLAFNILYHNKGVNSIYLSIEQKVKSLSRQMGSVGMKVKPRQSHMSIVDIGHLRKELGFLGGKNLSHVVKMFIERLKEDTGAEILVIDSLESLYPLLKMDNPRNDLFHFFSDLKNIGLTTFLVSEMEEEQTAFGRYGCESFLSDGIIHLANEKVGRSMVRYIRVVKMRAVDAPSDYFPLLVDDGFRVVSK